MARTTPSAASPAWSDISIGAYANNFPVAWAGRTEAHVSYWQHASYPCLEYAPVAPRQTLSMFVRIRSDCRRPVFPLKVLTAVMYSSICNP